MKRIFSDFCELFIFLIVCSILKLIFGTESVVFTFCCLLYYRLVIKGRDDYEH